jgi:Asp-tRNA(Asn)/Glu-tRNA(Gln) amidotransferase A subunit family amidase
MFRPHSSFRAVLRKSTTPASSRASSRPEPSCPIRISCWALEKDLDLWRGPASNWSVNLSPVSGFPAIVVPAGFTGVVYDRVPDASDPNGSRLDGPKRDQLPVAMEFLARPFGEGLLFEIAAAYEAGRSIGGRRTVSGR